MRFLTVCVMFCALVASARATEKKTDPQMQAVLDQLAALNPKPIDKLTPEEARKQPGPSDAVKALLKKQGKSVDPEPVGSVRDVTFPGAAGKLTARVYAPKGDGPFPVLAYFHGGGWVIAGIDAYDSSCRALCNAAGYLVVSCDYRRAPENPFPAAAEDAFAAYQWVLKNAADWKGDGKKVAVGGESAGGNLAAVVCLRARDKGIQPPVCQLLVYPVTNNNLDTSSYLENADAKPLNKPMMKWFFAHYIGNQAPHPYALPLLAGDFSRLPPATIITADIDPLRDDGKEYAWALTKAGVKADHKNFEGVTHEFFGMGAVIDKAKDAVKFDAAGLKAGFGK
ncbi:alpha/beta hydrolase [Zavarzinella formosa]|uniref:alpha/beta hydrolase n=1 Tax=Zavarzinella formosa TaxID=360055 RepID=UPI0002F17129|nr:alpha/beta hydrolase [Zavarzinella formosa]